MRIGLQGGDETVGGQREDAGPDEDDAAVLPYALPDQPGTADLGRRGEQKQGDGSQHRHGAHSITTGPARTTGVATPEIRPGADPPTCAAWRAPRSPAGPPARTPR